MTRESYETKKQLSLYSKEFISKLLFIHLNKHLDCPVFILHYLHFPLLTVPLLLNNFVQIYLSYINKWSCSEGGALEKVWRRHHPHPVSTPTHGCQGHPKTALWARGGALWILRVCESKHPLRLSGYYCNITFNMLSPANDTLWPIRNTTDPSS